jgi:hypothetical protein
MSGNEAKTPEDPEIVLGLHPSIAPRQISPKPVLSVVALALPLVGSVLGWVIGTALQRHDGSGAAWAPVGPLLGLGVGTVAVLVGTGLAIAALWRLERWPGLSFLALIVNGGFLLSAMQMLFG